MSEDKKKQSEWQMDLSEYIRQGEPDKKEKSTAWEAAIGLQDVDGLKTSPYLLQNAKEHIEGKIDIATVKQRLDSYYKAQENRKKVEDGTEEADKVSARIAEILSEKTFDFSPIAWLSIHDRLFHGVFKHAGKIRDYNITKNEWVLNGDTVRYVSCESIRETMEYDFSTEKDFSYRDLSLQDAVRHIAKFTSNIWQIHPFCEGNTRSTAVFIVKYLQNLGFNVDNTLFAENSWYFRNALVRANYNDIQKNIYSTTEFLEKFFENLLLGENNELKNRYLHVDYPEYQGKHSDVGKNVGRNVGTNVGRKPVNNEEAIISLLSTNPRLTAKVMAATLNLTERQVERIIKSLKDKGRIVRHGATKNGYWEVVK